MGTNGELVETTHCIVPAAYTVTLRVGEREEEEDRMALEELTVERE